MADINISTALQQVSSPVIDARNFSTPRLPPRSYRFQSSAIGAAPNVVLFRHFRGSLGGSINLSPGAGEVGTLLRGSSTFPLEFESDPDGFTALSFRKHKQRAGSFYLQTADCREFFCAYSRRIPQDKSFPGTTARETAPTGSVSKDHWFMSGANGGSVTANTDICLVTAVGGNRLIVQGNSSQPAVPDMAHIGDHWDWNGWNSFGVYIKANEADPLAGNGLIEQWFTSRKIGGSKTTGTRIQSSTVPVYGPSTPVALATSFYNYFYTGTYFVESDGAYIANAQERDLYLAIGAGTSRQHIMLLNAATIEAATSRIPYYFDAWNSSSNYVDFTTREWHTDITHVAIVKADGSTHISALADLEVLV